MDMISLHRGNLLAEDADALVNTVNTQGVMGKGIALQFKRAYPEMFKAYAAACRRGEVEPGRLHVWASDALNGPKWIINFPTKRHWRQPSRMADISAGLDALVTVIRDQGIRSIAIPPLGCGNGGLAWSEVLPLIEERLASVAPDVDIRVFEPAGAPAASAQVNRSAKPRLTPARAVLLTLMRRYEEATFEAPDPVEVQKLAYFLQVSGESLRLDFVNSHYGPYADTLRKTLRELEGHYIDGFGDGSAAVKGAEPLTVRDAVISEVDDYIRSHPEAEERVTAVLELIAGYESTYGLELLASVHKVVADEPARVDDVESVVQAVQAWSPRKGRLFTADHIRTAFGSLQSRGLAPVAAG